MTYNISTLFFNAYNNILNSPMKIIGKKPEIKYTKLELDYIDTIGENIYDNHLIYTIIDMKNKNKQKTSHEIASVYGFKQPLKDIGIDAGLEHKIPLSRRCKLIQEFSNYLMTVVNINCGSIPHIIHRTEYDPQNKKCSIIKDTYYSKTN